MTVVAGDTVWITKGPHTGRLAELTAVNGPKTVELAVLDQAGQPSFRLWNVKKIHVVKVVDRPRRNRT